MELFLRWLAANPYVLLFAIVAGAVLLGKISVRGYSLGMVASAIVVGAAISAWASTYGIRMKFDDFAKALFFYLFMYGIGLRTGPSFVNGLKRNGFQFVLLAVICSSLGLFGAVLFTKLWDLPTGAVGGILAGSMTISAAMGSADEAVRQGAVMLRPGETADEVRGMIAICYGLTYIWGTVGIILICKYLPRWWGVDARAAAKRYEEQYGVSSVDEAGLTGFRPLTVRAYRLDNEAVAGHTLRAIRARYPQYKILAVSRDGAPLGVDDDLRVTIGDVITIGGRVEAMLAAAGAIGAELPDAKALDIPIDAAEIVVMAKAAEGRTLADLQRTEYAGGVALHHIERGGVPLPMGLQTTLQRLDVLFVRGTRRAIDRMASELGRIARPSTITDLLTWAVGMVLGFVIGLIPIPIAGTRAELGAGAGLLISGILVSSLVSRLRFFGNTPHAARNIIEDLGLVLFIAMVGVNAGASLLSQLTPDLTLRILVAGFVCTTVPPFVVWAIGYHWMKINPAVLMGTVAGSRTHSGPALEASKEIGSSVPWVGFPIGYAVAEVILTVSGYVAMVVVR